MDDKAVLAQTISELRRDFAAENRAERPVRARDLQADLSFRLILRSVQRLVKDRQ